MMSGRVRGPSKHAVNRWVAALMPVIMMGLVGYATWVFVVLICINHLLLVQRRKPAAIILVTLYFVLFLLFAASYLRVLWIIYTNPGFVPKSPDASETIVDEKIGDGNDSDPEMGLGNVQREGGPRAGTAISGSGYYGSTIPKDTPTPEDTTENSMYLPRDLGLTHRPPIIQPHPGQKIPETQSSHMFLPPVIHQDRPPTTSTLQGHSYESYGLEPSLDRQGLGNLREWYNKDVFACEPDGRPRWCRSCNCYKPDRSHHCSEVQRCVYRMDHFCPWVGGVVAETSYKFFYQVVVYGTFYCLFLIISVATVVHEKAQLGGDVNSNWLATLALSCLFGLFSAGMAGSTTQLIYRNLSTVDALNYKTKVHQLAIHDPAAPQLLQPESQVYSPLVLRIWLPTNPMHGEEQRCFAIVGTQPGENPWRLENTIDNFKEVLGYSIWDWWLPVKRSPLVKKDSTKGFYRWNEGLLKRLRSEAGIETGAAL